MFSKHKFATLLLSQSYKNPLTKPEVSKLTMTKQPSAPVKKEETPSKFPRRSLLVILPLSLILLLCFGWIHIVSPRLSFGVQRESFKGIWVDPPGNFTQRLQSFLKALDQRRAEIWKNRKNHPWRNVNYANRPVVIGDAHPGYLQKVTKLTFVKTMFLRWKTSWKQLSYWTSLTDTANLPRSRVYDWAMDPVLCHWATVHALVSQPNYRENCHSNKRKVLVPTYMTVKDYKLHELALKDDTANAWYSKYFDFESAPEFVTYIHIVEDAVVTKSGAVLKQNTRIVPYTCYNWKAFRDVSEDFEFAPEYNEVFTVAQTAGPAVYHANMEQLPRLGAYIPFLLANPTIKIHLGLDVGLLSQKILQIVGIQVDRIITGIAKAKLLYVPQGIPCMYGTVFHYQTISDAYIQAITQKFGKQPRNSVVIIHRSRRRRIGGSDRLERMIHEKANASGLTVEYFTDAPQTQIHEAMPMFNRAVMIVGPHGAGFFNMLFSRPDTYILEILAGPPHTTLCYQRMARVLGHRYYGIAGSGQRVLSVDRFKLMGVVDFFMGYARQLARKK